MRMLLVILTAFVMSGCSSTNEFTKKWEDGTTTNYKSIGGTGLATGGITRATFTDCDESGKECRESEEVVKNTSLIGQLGGMGEAGIDRDGGRGRADINSGSSATATSKSKSSRSNGRRGWSNK